MIWKKLGQVYSAQAIDSYILTHAANPLAIHIKGDIFRIFFSGRDVKNRSSVAFVDIDLSNLKIINVCDGAIFKFNKKPDSFFSHGVSIGNTYLIENRVYMLFMGWQVRTGQHWKGDIGRLRLSSDNEMLVLVDEAPFLGIDDEDQVSLSYPWVMFENGLYRMWYGSTVTWECENNEMLHVIKYATSEDGINWKREGLAVPYQLNEAQAFSRPCVIRNDVGYHMWYSVRSGRGEKYRIGYSISVDGLNWKRQSNAGIDVSNSGWDSEMICYPFVFKHKNKYYMLYNGNNYGLHGFGLAVAE
jgi:hypothetical protein